MINLTVRSRKDVISELDRVAALKHLDRAQLLRIILEKGLEKEKIDLAIELYLQGDTMERAANVANVSIWDGRVECPWNHTAVRREPGKGIFRQGS